MRIEDVKKSFSKEQCSGAREKRKMYRVDKNSFDVFLNYLATSFDPFFLFVTQRK